MRNPLFPLLLAWDDNVALPLLRISRPLAAVLGAYLLVTALTPVLVRLSAHPVRAMLAALLVAAAAIDLVRLAGAWALGLANFVLVWALAGQAPRRSP